MLDNNYLSGMRWAKKGFSFLKMKKRIILI